jgi:hypothetical protein
VVVVVRSGGVVGDLGRLLLTQPPGSHNPGFPVLFAFSGPCWHWRLHPLMTGAQHALALQCTIMVPPLQNLPGRLHLFMYLYDFW